MQKLNNLKLKSKITEATFTACNGCNVIVTQVYGEFPNTIITLEEEYESMMFNKEQLGEFISLLTEIHKKL